MLNFKTEDGQWSAYLLPLGPMLSLEKSFQVSFKVMELNPFKSLIKAIIKWDPIKKSILYSFDKS